MNGNMFGGKNEKSLYTPMSESEQEALARIAEKGEFVVEVKGIGKVKIGEVIVGDHNLRLPLTISFIVPNGKTKVIPFLDLKLTTTSGIFLYADRLAFNNISGQPMQVFTGLTVPMYWTIGINQIDPEIVKAVLPKHLGLTSRRGNEKLTTDQRTVLTSLREGEKIAKRTSQKIVNESVKKARRMS